MEVMAGELRRQLLPLYSAKRDPDPIVHAKYFAPWISWTWHAIEFDGEDTFSGLVDGLDTELGYFSLSELQSAQGPGGLQIERDLYCEPKPLSQVRMHCRGSGA